MAIPIESAGVAGRSIDPATDHAIGFNPSENGTMAFSSDTWAELFITLLRNFPTTLTADQRTAIRNALSIVAGGGGAGGGVDATARAGVAANAEAIEDLTRELWYEPVNDAGVLEEIGDEQDGNSVYVIEITGALTLGGTNYKVGDILMWLRHENNNEWGWRKIGNIAPVSSTGAALETLSAFIASAVGVQAGAARSFNSANGDFLVTYTTTMAAPRPGFILPTGKTLAGVYDSGLDITAMFTVDTGNALRYVMNSDAYLGTDSMFLIRTS